jgi:hypothetical protein
MLHLSVGLEHGEIGKGAYVSSAISCGVWGRIWTFSCLRGVDTVAVGFWVDGRYSGPTHCDVAVFLESFAMLRYVYEKVAE